MKVEITPISPLAPEMAPLIERHLKLMHASSPACSIHAMDAATLASSGAAFFALHVDDVLCGMGALKALDTDHAELKSMHIVTEARGRGLARRLLNYLIETAHDAGHIKVSLETGSQPVFEAARSLYLSAGFEYCPPFGAYVEDSNSVFMTRV